jgi:hypothetical protein
LIVSKPAYLKLIIANTHPSLTASTLSLTVDPSESFIWTGPRSTRVLPIASGDSVQLTLEIVPLSGGIKDLPRVRLWEDPGQGDEKEELDVLLVDGEQKLMTGPVKVLVRP